MRRPLEATPGRIEESLEVDQLHEVLPQQGKGQGHSAGSQGHVKERLRGLWEVKPAFIIEGVWTIYTDSICEANPRVNVYYVLLS